MTREAGMRSALWISFMCLVTSSACGIQRSRVDGSSFTALEKRATEDSVRLFVLGVAHDVSQDGPTAWEKHFADSPSFFMAVNGQLVFSNSESANQGIQSFARTIQHIELHWGDDIRVDPLSADLAVVATPWVEVQTDLKGHSATTSGFFTAIAENRNGRWQFRDAHWSEPVATPKAP
jgi:hypothetical protein